MQYIIQENDCGLRLSEILKRRLGISSRLIIKLKRTDGILNNGQSVYVSTYPKEGDVITVVLPIESSYFDPEDIPIKTVYEDEDLLIIDKQPGIVVHPTKGHPTGTIANGLVKDMNEKQDVYKIRFINRLDRDTSGLLIIGKNSFAQEALSIQMKENKVVKKYIAILEGQMKEDEGVINKPIKKEEGDIVRIIAPDGQESITEYRVLKRLEEYTVAEITLLTGRTHQIRVHMASIGHPVVGDELYGIKGNEDIGRQALHAQFLSFIHPMKKTRMEVVAEIPADMLRIIEG